MGTGAGGLAGLQPVPGWEVVHSSLRWKDHKGSNGFALVLFFGR